MHINNSKIKRRLFSPLIGFCRWLGRNKPELLAKIRYRARFGKRLDLDNPQTLNEKILYLALRTDTTKWTDLTDKYKVREFIEAKGFGDTLVKLYGHWTDAADIDFDALPEKFILKTNHGSGGVIAVEDKSQMDRAAAVKELNHSLGQTYGELESGLHYYRIKPCVIAEELLTNDEESARLSSSIIDYKIWCFDGKPCYTFICSNRESAHIDMMIYDNDWVAHPEYGRYDSFHRKGRVMPKPKNFEQMLHIAEALAAGFPCVRVDLYNLGGKIYFGEMTFTSLGGLMNYFSDDFQMLAGQMITLPEKKV